MSSIEARRPALVGAVVFAVAAAIPVAWLYGFTVDDALIPARIASHIRAGLGHRFNRLGPVADAVTPFGWACLLAPFASGGPLAALHFAKGLGVLVWCAAAALLGMSVARGKRAIRWTLAAPLAACAPLGAWPASGMETGVVIALCTFATVFERSAPFSSGAAVILRPELAPWSMALAAARAVVARRTPARVFGASVAAAAPAIGVAAARTLWFGSPVPLAVWAKPSDLAHGAFYVLAALAWTGIPILVLAPLAIRRLGGEERAILFAAAVHALALFLVGGDWMPLFRLFTPMLPGLLLVGARLADIAPSWLTAVRVVLSVIVSAVLLTDKGAAARGVMAQRLRLIERARPVLAGARVVATVDAGWVGAATAADVVDLAGVTDPEIARLPGGHTSKRVPARLLRTRGVDAMVLLVEGPLSPDYAGSSWGRAVEARVASFARDFGFVPTAELELSGTGLRYVVLRLKLEP